MNLLCTGGQLKFFLLFRCPADFEGLRCARKKETSIKFYEAIESMSFILLFVLDN